MSTIGVTVGQRLKQARERAGMGTNELTRVAGLSNGVVTRLEQDKSKNTESDTFVRLAKALGVRLEWLVQGVGAVDDSPASEPPIRELVVEKPHRYPNAVIASKIALDGGLAPVAVDRVMGTLHESESDLSVLEWLDLMKAMHSLRNRARKSPLEVARQREIEMAAVDDDEEEGRPQLDSVAEDHARQEAQRQARKAAGLPPVDPADEEEPPPTPTVSSSKKRKR